LLRIFKKTIIFNAKMCTLLIWSALNKKKVSMQPKFTLKQVGLFTGRALLTSALLLFVFFTTNAQSLFNGNLSTGATHSTGTAAPTGTTWSELQGANSTLGTGVNITAGYSVADNFTVPVGGPSWIISKFTFFAYSTGFTGASSPFNDVRLLIYNTDPSVGSPTPIFGDFTTNRFTASSFSNMYRTSGASADQSRRIWQIEANVNVTLAPGTYWVEWALGNGGLSNFSPLNTVAGNANPGGNAKQRTFTSGLPGTWAGLVDGGNPQDMPFKVDYATGPCSGTPAPGNTISTATTACPGVNFTLTLQNATSGSGVTYQWQSSPDGSTWTNIAGATNNSLIRNHSASTYYRCQVTCSGNTGSSNAVLVALTPTSGCYCIPPTSNCAVDDVILNVTLNTLNNTSTCTTGGFTYFSSVAAPDVFIGASNPMSVRVGPGGTEHVAVWIDYDRNGSFDANEFTALGSGNGTTISNNIVVPSNVTSGPTRMRVRVRWSTALTGTQSCFGYSFGETEDYNVNLVPCVPVRYATQPANATVTCGGNATFSVTATGTLPAYRWQYRTSATGVWMDLPNGGPVSGATTATLTLTSVPATWNGYQVRAMLRGGCAGDDPSSAATVTVNAPVATVSPASAVICNTSSQTLALTNLVSVPATFTANSGTISVTIPESATGATSASNTLNVSGIPAGSVITRIDVKLNVTHSWVGDVVANIKAPNGAIFNLAYVLSATGGAGATTGFTNTVISSAGTALLSSGSNPYTGIFRADAVSGTPPAGFPPYGPTGYIPTTNTWGGLTSTPNGNWTLALYDYYVDPDPGRLTNWTLEITYVAPNYAQGIWTSTPSTPSTMYLDAALTQAYDGSAQTTVYVKPAVNTTYSVSFTNPLNGCVSAVTNVPVTVGVPITGLTAPATVATCVGSGFSIAATHAAVPSTNATPTYQWQVSADGGVNWTNISGATGATLSVASTTQSMNGYRYRIQVTSGGCTVVATTPTVLTVYALPTVTLAAASRTLTPGKTITITANSTPAAAANGWSWTLNGASVAGTSNTQTVNIDGLGSYHATVRDINGCVSTSKDPLIITAEASDKLWIYPNPTAGAFQIRYYHAGDANEKRIISVYNAAGQLVASKSFDLTYTSAPYLRMDVDLSGAARGTYVVKVAHEYSGKIVSGLVLVQ
jgi:subtilisin-like proprotein convertase family protein